MIKITSKRINIEFLLGEGLDKKIVIEDFKKQVDLVKNELYKSELTQMFNYAVKNNPTLFTNIAVSNTGNLSEMCNEYIKKWISKYSKARSNPAIKRSLKAYGEKDPALVKRVAVNTNAKSDTLDKYLTGHFVYMSAENMNGEILEEYLASVLEPFGWCWCAGAIYRSVDFCYLKPGKEILLQVKNKYNTENSSSSAIRNGTKIIKWNRLNKPRTDDLDSPIPNWEKLCELIAVKTELSELLTEEKYLEYIENNSSTDILEHR